MAFLPRDVRIKTFSTHDTLLSAAGKLEQAWNGLPKIKRLYEQFMQNLERADVYGGLRVELQVADYG